MECLTIVLSSRSAKEAVNGPFDGFDTDIEALFHKCLVRILPEIEKK
jgi:hypothetical protein